MTSGGTAQNPSLVPDNELLIKELSDQIEQKMAVGRDPDEPEQIEHIKIKPDSDDEEDNENVEGDEDKSSANPLEELD